MIVPGFSCGKLIIRRFNFCILNAAVCCTDSIRNCIAMIIEGRIQLLRIRIPDALVINQCIRTKFSCCRFRRDFPVANLRISVLTCAFILYSCIRIVKSTGKRNTNNRLKGIHGLIILVMSSFLCAGAVIVIHGSTALIQFQWTVFRIVVCTRQYRLCKLDIGGVSIQRSDCALRSTIHSLQVIVGIGASRST